MLINDRLYIAIIVMALVTFATRAMPFIIFGKTQKAPPQMVLYLGKYLPPAIICCILVYSFRDVNFLESPFALREIVSAGVAVLLYLFSKNALLSIVSSTAVYMFFIQVIQL